MLPLLLKALSKAMLEWPLFRSCLSSSSPSDKKPTLTIRPTTDIMLALSTPTGLYTPTLQSVSTKSPYTLAGEIARLQRLGMRIPSGLTMKEMPHKGGTVTVSNIGAIGNGEFAAPILVPGGGFAIVAIGRARWDEVWIGGRDGHKALRYTVGTSWSADHRVVEGGELAAFVESWRGWVEHPQRLVGDGV